MGAPKLIFAKTICLLLTLSCHCANSNDADIVRGEYDRFANIAEPEEKVRGCRKTNAVCFDKNCTYCQCKLGQTFVQRKGCVSNELMVYAASYEASFLLYNQNQQCFYQNLYKRNAVVEGLPVCDKIFQNSLWIWTNFGQLLNWRTLQCMTDEYGTNSVVSMKKCDRNNQKQLWKCVGDKKYNIVQLQSGRYMYNGNNKYVTTGATSSKLTKWMRYTTKKDVCSQAVGCEIFADGSSLVILNKTKCKERSECLEEKHINLNKTKCFLLSNKTQYIHNDTWKELKIKNGSFDVTSSANKISLKWNLKKTLKSWGGLIVKIPFMCEDATGTRTEHCVVIKYAGSFTGFRNDDRNASDSENVDGQDDDGTDRDKDNNDGDNDGNGGDNDGNGGDNDGNGGDNDGNGGDNDGNGGDNDGNGGDNDGNGGDNDGNGGDNDGNGGDNDGNGGNNDGDITTKPDVGTELVSNGENKNNSQKTIIIILVCVIVVLLLAGIVGIIIYKRKNRHTRSKKGYKENQDQNQPSTVKELAVPLNPLHLSNRYSTRRESQQYEVPCEHIYEQIDETAPPQAFAYDYAIVDGPLKQVESVETAKEEDCLIKKDAGDSSSMPVIESRPDTAKKDAHDVISDVSYISVIG